MSTHGFSFEEALNLNGIDYKLNIYCICGLGDNSYTKKLQTQVHAILMDGKNILPLLGHFTGDATVLKSRIATVAAAYLSDATDGIFEERLYTESREVLLTHKTLDLGQIKYKVRITAAFMDFEELQPPNFFVDIVHFEVDGRPVHLADPKWHTTLKELVANCEDHVHELYGMVSRIADDLLHPMAA